MDKAPDAFRTISEVADHLETPAHVLRFWETRFPQVKPVKGAGGRRYYRPSDVALLSGIRRLLHNDGMTIRGVQKILREQGVRHVAELGGEALEAPEPLEALLPQPKPPAEVVALRPAEPVLTDELSAIRNALSAMMALGEDQGAASAPAPGARGLAPDPVFADATEPLDLAAFDGPLSREASEEAGPVSLLPELSAPEILAPDDLAPEGMAPETLPPEALPRDTKPVSPAAPFAPPLGGIGGFGLDLDVPRGGEGGFIAFSDSGEPSRAASQGFVHPDARPKAKPGSAQPSLFDLMAADQSPVEEAPEAPHVFVEDEDFDTGPGAEISAFPASPDVPLPEDLPPEPEPGWTIPPEEIPEDAPPEDVPPADIPPEGWPEDAPPEELPEDWPGDLPPEASPAEEAVFAHHDSAAPPEPWAAASESASDPAALAGLAPRLRALSSVDPERLFALADLQARLGLLHAQMAEASARPRRSPGE